MFFTVATYAQKAKGKAMQWEIAAELPALNGKATALGVAGPVAGVHDNKLIVGGGANFPDSMPWLGGKKKYYDDVFVFEKRGNSLSLLSIKVKLSLSIAYSANCSSEKGIIVAGGENENGISNKVFLLQWNKKLENAIIEKLPDLPFAITNAAIVSANRKVYLAGGETASGVSNQFLVLDLDNTGNGWKELPPVPQALSHTVLLAQNNVQGKSIYAAGGRKKNSNGISDLYSSLFEFDLQKNEWKEKRSLPYALSAGTGIVTQSGYLLLFGGDKGNTFHKTEQLIAAISKETSMLKRDSLNKEKIYLQSSHPGFSNEVLLYDILKDEWKVIDHVPFDVPVTTTAIQWNGSVIIPSGEIKAGVRSPYILQGKISIAK